MLRRSSVVLAFLISLLGQARALRHPLTDIPANLEGVDATFHFPGHEDLKFPVGETLTVLCHVINNDEAPINVTAIMGSLNVAYQFQQHIQNFTYKPFSVVVKPDEEITLQYEFEVYKELDVSQEYSLAHSLFYDSEGVKKRRHANTFFNQTIEIYNNDSDFEGSAIFELVSILVSTVVMVLLVLAACLPDNAHVKNARAFVNKTKFFRSLTSTSYFEESGSSRSSAGRKND